MPQFPEFEGHYQIVYSPDDGGYYADMWEDPDLDSGILSTYAAAKKFAVKHGGAVEHRDE